MADATIEDLWADHAEDWVPSDTDLESWVEVDPATDDTTATFVGLSELTLPTSLKPASLLMIAMILTTMPTPAGLSVSSGPLPSSQMHLHQAVPVSDRLKKTPSTLLSSKTEQSLSKSPGLLLETPLSKPMFRTLRRSLMLPLPPVTSM